MVTREQLISAILLNNDREKHVETLQLTVGDYPEEWQPLATTWCLIALQKLQQNAVTLDGMLEQLDEGKVVEQEIPPTPVEYNRLLALEKLKEKRGNPVTLFEDAVKTGDAVLVDLMLQDERVDPSAGNNWAIQYASEKGYLDAVEQLLQDSRVDPSAHRNIAIRVASERGCLAIVDRLLQDPRVNPSAVFNYAIQLASGNGHLAVVDRLLQDPRVDPSVEDNVAIKWASHDGHLAVVDRLLQEPRVDPSANNNWAIRMAYKHHTQDVVNRLLQDPRVDPSVIQTATTAT
jgi:hypothetical protein